MVCGSFPQDNEDKKLELELRKKRERRREMEARKVVILFLGMGEMSARHRGGRRDFHILIKESLGQEM